MNLRYYKEYQRLAEEGKFPYLTCPDDPKYGVLYTGEDDAGMFLACPFCDYKLRPGLHMDNLIKEKVDKELQSESS